MEINEVILNVGKHKTVRDLAATICHEMCHRVIEEMHPHLRFEECIQHNYIYPVHMRYMYDLAAEVEGSFTDEYIEFHEDRACQFERKEIDVI
jgi:hypothetical protein